MFELAIIATLIVLGFIFGSFAERKHFANLEQRESSRGKFLVTQIKNFPASAPSDRAPQLLVAETVIATDYFKSFLANLRRIFGGEVRSFNSLLDRARRETTQRLVDQARERGYNAICNVRLITADVGGTTANSKGAVMVAILGSATAYQFDDSSTA